MVHFCLCISEEERQKLQQQAVYEFERFHYKSKTLHTKKRKAILLKDKVRWTWRTNYGFSSYTNWLWIVLGNCNEWEIQYSWDCVSEGWSLLLTLASKKQKCLPFTQPSLSPKYFQNLDKKSIIDHTNSRMWLCESDKLKYTETFKN